MRERLLRVPARVYGWAAFLYASGIFFLSAMPGSTFGRHGAFVSFLFNLFHAPLYCGFALFVCLALVQRGPAESPARFRFPGSRAALAVTLTMIYASLDEWHQSFVTDRSPDVSDLVTDLGGALFAVLAVRFLVETDVRRGRMLAGVGGLVLLVLLSSLAATFGLTAS